jgi:hypothetical protein
MRKSNRFSVNIQNTYSGAFMVNLSGKWFQTIGANAGFKILLQCFHRFKG